MSATVTTTSVFSGVVVVLEDVLSDFVLVVWAEVFEEELFVPEASELDEVELCELGAIGGLLERSQPLAGRRSLLRGSDEIDAA